MEDGINAANVGKESISQTLPFMGSFNQTSNIHNIKIGRNFAVDQITLLQLRYLFLEIFKPSWLVEVTEVVKSIIRHCYPAYKVGKIKKVSFKESGNLSLNCI